MDGGSGERRGGGSLFRQLVTRGSLRKPRPFLPSFLPPPPPVISSAPLQRAWLIGTKNLPIARCPGTICKYVQEDIYKKCSSHKAMKFRKLIDSTNPSITLLNGWRLNPRQIPFNDHSLMLGLDSIYVCDILDLVKVIGKIN